MNITVGFGESERSAHLLKVSSLLLSLSSPVFAQLLQGQFREARAGAVWKVVAENDDGR